MVRDIVDGLCMLVHELERKVNISLIFTGSIGLVQCVFLAPFTLSIWTITTLLRAKHALNVAWFDCVYTQSLLHEYSSNFLVQRLCCKHSVLIDMATIATWPLNLTSPVLNRCWHSSTIYTTRVPSQAWAWFNHQRLSKVVPFLAQTSPFTLIVWYLLNKELRLAQSKSVSVNRALVTPTSLLKAVVLYLEQN